MPDDGDSLGLMAPAADGVEISCRFFTGGRDNANFLFFHGNGELAGEYDDVGQLFNRAGINLFAADYRGYGRSGGRPTVSGMIKDAPFIARFFGKYLEEKGFGGGRFIMGRSLGSASAIDLAANHPAGFRGVVIESGFCDVSDLLGRHGLALRQEGRGGVPAPGLARVKRISMPALVIHGEYDSIVPLAEGEKIYASLGSADRQMLVIPGADHNSVLAYGMELYLRELAAFAHK
jgi:pimeloyl-ACP methyl ester carboxylesterase